MERHEFFVTCAPGVEPVLFQEMKVLKFPKVECQVGGVYFKGTGQSAIAHRHPSAAALGPV